MDDVRVFVDTNVLLRLQSPESRNTEEAQTAVDWLRSHGNALCIAPQNVAEFWNVCTRPRDRNGFELSTKDAMARLAFVESITELLIEQPITYTLWRDLLVQHAIRGVQVHDARLVAIMQTYNLNRILTYNYQDFARYAHIEVIDPRDAIQQQHSFGLK